MSSEQSPTQHAALDAHYEIIRELGRGGTALVYLARERASGAEVAIKVIRAKYIDDEEAQARFAREARFVAQLYHPNIVPMRAVLDLGDAGIALVMGHVEGRTLRQVIRADGRLTAARTEYILRDMARALSAAHAMGIVHRDVKPENIFIDADDRAVLADFGLARSMTADTQLTMSGVAIGTPAYMAPEQIEGGELDARADVYSLGLVAWEMLTGHKPWDGQSLYAILYHQKHEFLPDVRDVRDDVPDRLAEVIVRAIEKDRDLRWQSMYDLLGALDASAPLRLSVRRTPVSADTTRFVRPPTPPTSAPAPTVLQGERAVTFLPVEFETRAVATQAAFPLAAAPSSPRRRMAAMAVGTATALAAVVALVTFAVRGRSAEGAPPEPEHTAPATVATDVATPIQLGAPIDSLAIAGRDTTQHPPADSVARAPAMRVVNPLRLPALNQRLADRVVAGESAAGNRAAERTSPNGVPAPTTSQAGNTAGPTAALSAGASIVAGGTHSCLIAADGRALCWGNNDRGQLGNGGASRTSSPGPVGTDARFAAIAAGLSHSCAITRAGTAWCWGNNDHGQLGDRSAGQRLAPVRAADEHVFRTIAAGGAHTCGLDTYGVAWCWGANTRGQLGDSSTRDSAVPVGAGLGTIRFLSVVAGWNFTCAIATNGRASCWGENSAGQLGDGTTLDRYGPTPVGGDIVFTSIATGSAHACGVTAQGEAYCWGRNTNGQLGDGTTVDRTAPVRVRGTVRFASITAGAVHTCAVSDDGVAYCWGRNTYGQLGNGTNTDESQPANVSGGYRFAAVRAFGSHTCGASASGEPLCWGYNLESQLGDGTRINRTRPVHVETPTGG